MTATPLTGTFCDKCIAESSDQTPGDVNTYNGIGRKFYGSKSPCAQCGSVIRTLWWTLIDVPIIPLGSYRYKKGSETIQSSRFWARRTATQWDQVFKTWIVGIVLAAAAIGAVFWWESRKK